MDRRDIITPFGVQATITPLMNGDDCRVTYQAGIPV